MTLNDEIIEIYLLRIWKTPKILSILFLIHLLNPYRYINEDTDIPKGNLEYI